MTAQAALTKLLAAPVEIAILLHDNNIQINTSSTNATQQVVMSSDLQSTAYGALVALTLSRFTS